MEVQKSKLGGGKKQLGRGGAGRADLRQKKSEKIGHEKRKNFTWDKKGTWEKKVSTWEGERETWKIGKVTWEGDKN